VHGSIRFEGRELIKLPDRAMRDLRGNRIAMIFQDPMTSLHPMLTIGVQIAESLTRHKGMAGRAAWRRAVELLDLVRISEPERSVARFPGELSGGMRQRVMIAMALACEPQLLIADEPTTALDVTIQAEIIALVKDLRRKFGMTLIWITHDLGVVAGLADTINVMYAGQVVECGPVDDIFADPRHAYTLGLLQSLPQSASPRERLRQMTGGPPDLSALTAGDPFASRNPFATERCWRECPPLAQAAGAAPGHRVAAWYDLRKADRRAGRTNV
jgi:peptide/nickel transport system ATP-binding protein/oligopeptide transport system ATP-binding protein